MIDVKGLEIRKSMNLLIFHFRILEFLLPLRQY
ncbi:hypothetical protein M2101_000393 [Parabacteroides sp. PM5-20]|nr:hypothetical protein [Parabacteroides sp. PM5-20]